MTSNATKFGAIDEGRYNGNYMSPGKRGPLSSHWALNETGAVRMLDGQINPFQPSQVDENGEGFKLVVYIHRSNNSGFAGEVDGGTNGISVACLLIDPRDWDKFNGAMSGVKHFMVQVEREVEIRLPALSPWYAPSSIYSAPIRVPNAAPSVPYHFMKQD